VELSTPLPLAGVEEELNHSPVDACPHELGRLAREHLETLPQEPLELLHLVRLVGGALLVAALRDELLLLPRALQPQQNLLGVLVALGMVSQDAQPHVETIPAALSARHQLIPGVRTSGLIRRTRPSRPVPRQEDLVLPVLQGGLEGNPLGDPALSLRDGHLLAPDRGVAEVLHEDPISSLESYDDKGGCPGDADGTLQGDDEDLRHLPTLVPGDEGLESVVDHPHDEVVQRLGTGLLHLHRHVLGVGGAPTGVVLCHLENPRHVRGLRHHRAEHHGIRAETHPLQHDHRTDDPVDRGELGQDCVVPPVQPRQLGAVHDSRGSRKDRKVEQDLVDLPTKAPGSRVDSHVQLPRLGR